ncbi:response regulator [Luteimonas deserti]|uniref:Response regulator n=1 Tax=Luteimonas deserti TaxID=2752306 RepID=A0A7Z0TVL9_9GAMM|nr:response regulator [Luteimonas deserti]NYZ63996.1 response regulator [Luteimonas deserti]
MSRASRILVVEDEYVLALHLEEELLARGVTVLGPFAALADVQATLEAGDRPDAAILDVNLAGTYVFPVAERLRQLGVPFLFASGYDRTVLPPHFADVPLCTKPVDVEKALRALGL